MSLQSDLEPKARAEGEGKRLTRKCFPFPHKQGRTREMRSPSAGEEVKAQRRLGLAQGHTVCSVAELEFKSRLLTQRPVLFPDSIDSTLGRILAISIQRRRKLTVCQVLF